MSITPLRMTSESALRIIRKTALDSSNVYIPDHPNAQEWEERVNHLQVIHCLREGTMVNQPNIDTKGNLECQLERLCAGIQVKVTVAMMKNNDAWMLIVRKVERQP